MKATSRAFIVALALCVSGVVFAASPGGRRSSRPRRDALDASADLSDYVHHVLGAKLIVLGETGGEEDALSFGPGLIYELTLIPHWLELELAGSLLVDGEAARVPLDLLVKKPFQINHIVDAFAGVGPMISISRHEGHLQAHAGIIGSVGTFFWVWPQAGFLLELDYAFVAEGDGTHEVEGACGLAIRFR